MQTLFSDEQLLKIVDQAMVYQCACPAQVATVMRELRRVDRYQQNCLNQTGTDEMVHQRISADVRSAHAVMEQCLEAVLQIEGWNMQTLEMPVHLRKQLRAD